MKTEILKCVECKKYTLEKSCPNCNNNCISPKPAKFSIEDKYGHYRRIAKNELENK
jgi:H/ACA ribonucleoprotein complex subunit 3